MENKQNQPSSGNSNAHKNTQSATPSSFAQQPVASADNADNTLQRTSTQKDATAKSQLSEPRSANTANTEGASAGLSASALLNSVEERLTQGKSDVQSWISQTDWRSAVNQLPQSVKDLGTKATEQFNKLTTTQKVVGGALLLGGLGYLASRSSQKNNDSEWSTAKARRNDYRSGNIPRVESSQRSSEWNKRTTPSAASTASSSSADRNQDARRTDRGSLGHVNIDS